MNWRSWRVLACCALLLAAVLGWSAPAEAVGQPSLTAIANIMSRGSSTTIQATNFAASTSYTVTADNGALGSPGAAAVVITSSGSGAFQLPFKMTGDVPADINTVTISAADTADPTVLASITIAVMAPGINGSACPGKTFAVRGTGFPDGDYVMRSDYVTFNNAVSSVDGVMPLFSALAATHLPTQFSVTVTPQGSNAPILARTWAPAPGRVSVHATTPWAQAVTGTCFEPGETVRLQPADTYLTAPATTTADASGAIAFTMSPQLGAQPRQTSGVAVRGLNSGQSASTGIETLNGTSLTVGKSLSSRQGETGLIAASQPGYAFHGSQCDPVIVKISPGGQSSTTWYGILPHGSVASNCRLTMQADGNLVLYSLATKAALWSTHTTGTGTNNRLVMRTDGRAVIYTARDIAVWSSTGWTSIANGYYETNPGGTIYKVKTSQRWRVSAATWNKIRKMHPLHPMTKTTMAKLPLHGII